ncbi:MAG: translocation/assembly module TamB domain-containing protein [Gammaproteobacteria bacterium]
MKRWRLVILLVLLLPLLVLGWLLASESGLQWAYRQAESYLPQTLSIQHISGSLAGPMTLDDVRFSQDGVQIKAETIIVNLQLSALFAANIDVSQLYIKSLDIVLEKTQPPAQTPPQTDAITLPDISLPWLTVIRQAEVDGFTLTQDEQSFSLNQIKLSASTLFSQIDIKQLDVIANTFSFNLSGKLKAEKRYKHNLKINWQATLPSSAVLKGSGQLKGDIHATQLTQKLSGPLQLSLDGNINDLLDQLSWQASVDASAFDLVKLDPALPALSGALKFKAQGDLSTATASGTLDGNTPDTGAFDAVFELQRLVDNSIQIKQLKLHSAITQTQLEANGRWHPASNGGDVDVALKWINLRWPMLQEPTWFNSASGDGTITGSLDGYRIELNTDSPWPQVIPSTWQASATGNLDGLEFQSLHINTLDGEVNATAKLDWSNIFNWNANIIAANIDPAGLLPQWPGKLSAKLGSTGRYENDQLIADADIKQLSGVLRGYPVALRSRLGWKNDSLNISQLNFNSGTSQLTLSGQAGDSLKLDWTINSSNLAELYPQAKGTLQAKGQLSGPRDTPVIKASINGKALKLPGYEVGEITGKLNVDLFSWQQIDISLNAQTLKLNNTVLQSLSINASPGQLQAKTVSKQVTTDIELKGAAYAQGWRGRLTRASVQSQQFHNWQLDKPVALDINQDQFVADTLCWHSNKEARLCTTLQQKQTVWHANVTAQKLPLLILSPWLPPDMKLEGLANASAQLQYQPPDQLLGEASIDLPAGVVSYPLLEGERERWEYRHGKLIVTLKPKAVNASADFAMSNGDRLHAELTLPDANLLSLDFEQQPLQANAQLTIHELGIIEALVPEIQDLQGKAEVNITAGGTLAQPRLKGRANLLNSSLRIPRLGLKVEALSLKAQSDGFEKLNFNLAAKSGDGKLEMTGVTRLDSAAGWPTEINIKGEDFEVSRIPEARVNVTPDIKIKLQHRTIDISGKVHVPYAKLQPNDITTAAKVSDDAVIIGGEQVVEQKWITVTRVRVTLGERVNFYGFGFEGRFGGSLLIEDVPGQLTTATGEITIPEGRYRAYGQRLEVEHGRVLFTGGPLTNPGLDLRAVRRVNNVTAGLRVRGSLNQPVLELFSIPTMGETDVLAYLLLGRPIENASDEEGAMMAKATLALGLSGGDRIARLLGDRFGLDEMRVESSESGDQASLVVGRYLSPKLYVSYGVGLIEAINTLSVRYQISEKWQLKAESGEAQGADILYTFER